MSWLDDFAEGFASGFIPAYENRMKVQAAEDQTILQARINAAQTTLEQRREQEQAHRARLRQAQGIVNATGIGDVGLAYQLLETYEDADTVTEMLRSNPVAELTAAVPAPTPTAVSNNTSPANPRTFAEAQPGIFAGESGGDYDALFNFQNREGGRFSNVRLTEMTVDQALEFANPRGDYAGYVRGEVGHTATPMGAYQVVGTTLRAAKEGLGLTGQEVMTPELQDRIGQWIFDNQGIEAWVGYRPTGGTTTTASTRSPVDGQMADLGMDQPAANENGMPDNLFTTMMGWNQAARERDIDARFNRFAEASGLDVNAPTGGFAAPQSNFRLNMGPAGADLSDLVGKDPQFIDQWLVVNGGRLSDADRANVQSIRDISAVSKDDPEWWKDTRTVATMDRDNLVAAIALEESEEGRARLTTALEAMPIDEDLPSSPREAAFREFLRSDDFSGLATAADRIAANATFERTWNQLTQAPDTFSIVSAIGEANTVGDAVALRSSIELMPEIEDDLRSEWLGIVDDHLGDLKSAQGDSNYSMGDYTTDLIRYTRELSSPDEAVRNEAVRWFAEERPTIESAFMEAATMDQRAVEQALIAAGIPADRARLAALGQLEVITDPVSRTPFIGNSATGEIYNPIMTTPTALTPATSIPDDFDMATASSENLALANTNSDAIREEAASIEQEMDLFAQRLGGAEIGASLGLRGRFNNFSNALAGFIGAEGSFSDDAGEARVATGLLTQLNRLTKLRVAESFTNVRGSVYLLQMLDGLTVQPNENITVNGALEQFQSTYSLLSSEVANLERIASGQAGVSPADVSAARAALPGLQTLVGYYDALIGNLSTGVQGEAPSGRNFLTGEQAPAPAAEPTVTQDQALQQARDAIARGANREAVIQRLTENGFDASGL